MARRATDASDITPDSPSTQAPTSRARVSPAATASGLAPPAPHGRACALACARAAARSSHVHTPARPHRAAQDAVRSFSAPIPASIDPLYRGQYGGEYRPTTPCPANSARTSPPVNGDPLSLLSTSGAP